eukprot:TRINITY_DN3755_c0_g1_i1.p1 TRINITY_DN3755_c0_g1~~TRINITY_DN3755_c0_g1_i1.p1  ORF type:complete len:657 (+),score=206.31 TRINITY_DN3755_c0_g1_i1:59-2029(+)
MSSQDQLKDLNTKIDALSATKSKLQAELEQYKSQLAQAKAELQQTESSINAYQNQKNGLNKAPSTKAPPPSGASDPGQWKEFKTDDGRTYYFNKATKETTWKNPNMTQEEAWREVKTPEGKVYYYNRLTKETTWTNPALRNAATPSQPAAPATTNNSKPSNAASTAPLPAPASAAAPKAGFSPATPRGTSSFAPAVPGGNTGGISGNAGRPLVGGRRTSVSATKSPYTETPQEKQARIKQLKDKIAELNETIKSKLKTKQGLEKLVAFTPDMEASNRAKNEIEVLNKTISNIREEKSKHERSLAEICPDFKPAETDQKGSTTVLKRPESSAPPPSFPSSSIQAPAPAIQHQPPPPVNQPSNSAGIVIPPLPTPATNPEARKKQLEEILHETKEILKATFKKKTGVEKLVGFYGGGGGDAVVKIKQELEDIKKVIEDLKERKKKITADLEQLGVKEKEEDKETSKKSKQPKFNPWRAVPTEDGRCYYYNSVTKETTWENPNPDEEDSLNNPSLGNSQDDPQQQQQQEATPPTASANTTTTNSQWMELLDEETGIPYYYNETTGESSWTNPNEEQPAAPPEAQPEAPAEEEVAPAPEAQPERTAEALYDYEAEDPERELSFKQGQLITVAQYEDPVWWYGFYGEIAGYFPSSYVAMQD